MKYIFPFEVLDPWTEIDGSGDKFVSELIKEMRNDDELYGNTFKAIAQRIDCDDVLFRIKNQEKMLAVIHLSWSGHTDPNKGWPSRTIYSDLNTWKDKCMVPDYEDYNL